MVHNKQGPYGHVKHGKVLEFVNCYFPGLKVMRGKIPQVLEKS